VGWAVEVLSVDLCTDGGSIFDGLHLDEPDMSPRPRRLLG
jgi:hypothetical protein